MVRENIVKIHESRFLNSSDLMGCRLELDRRMVDYCVGLDTEFSALVEGNFFLVNFFKPMSRFQNFRLSVIINFSP